MALGRGLLPLSPSRGVTALPLPVKAPYYLRLRLLVSPGLTLFRMFVCLSCLTIPLRLVYRSLTVLRGAPVFEVVLLTVRY